MFYAKRFMEKVIVLDLIIIYLTWKNSSNFKKFVQDCFYKYAWVTQDFMPIHANKKRVLTTYLTHKVTYLINTGEIQANDMYRDFSNKKQKYFLKQYLFSPYLLKNSLMHPIENSWTMNLSACGKVLAYWTQKLSGNWRLLLQDSLLKNCTNLGHVI